VSDRKRLHNRKQLKARRRQLRRRQTPAERRLWESLRARRLDGRTFRRQHSIGPYIVDFYCAAEHLVIELDGASHDAPNRRGYDDARTRFLQRYDLRVIRFENRTVFDQLDIVLAAITAHWRT
jgi:very-short-patch-repair endonuclease